MLTLLCHGRQRQKDLTGVRKRGSTYQVRVFSGIDPVTGQKAYLTGSASDEAGAIRLRDKYRREIEENKAARTSVTLAYLLDEWMATHNVEVKTRQGYELLIRRFIKPTLGDLTLPKLARLGPQALERFYADLMRCRSRCNGRPFIEHNRNCERAQSGNCHERCARHVCKPLAASTVRQVDAVLSGALGAVVRWGWIGINTAAAAKRPRALPPRPNPPTSEEAARIAAAAWEQDADWGMFVWLTLVTGARRGELVALRGKDFDSATGMLTIERSVIRGKGELIVKDTKTHQMRRIALDETTSDLLNEHWDRYKKRCEEAARQPDPDAYFFSYEADNSRPSDPDGITHRYARMTANLGIKTTYMPYVITVPLSFLPRVSTFALSPAGSDMAVAVLRRSGSMLRGTRARIGQLHPY